MKMRCLFLCLCVLITRLRFTFCSNSSCKFADGKDGFCTSLKNCPLKDYQEILKINVIDLLRITCGRDLNGDVHICCPRKSQSNPQCGKSDSSNRTPWIVLIGPKQNNKFTSICSGVLIDSQHILSDASCVYFLPDRKLFVRLGGKDLQSLSVERPISRYIMHPIYNGTTLDGNIALYKMASSVEFNNDIKPICLPSTDELFPQQIVSSYLINNNNQSDVYYQNKFAVPVDQLTCGRYFSGRLTNNNICANYTKSCDGHDLTPMLTMFNSEKDTFEIAGVGATGILNCKDTSPDAFTSVGAYRQWVIENIRLN